MGLRRQCKGTRPRSLALSSSQSCKRGRSRLLHPCLLTLLDPTQLVTGPFAFLPHAYQLQPSCPSPNSSALLKRRVRAPRLATTPRLHSRPTRNFLTPPPPPRHQTTALPLELSYRRARTPLASHQSAAHTRSRDSSDMSSASNTGAVPLRPALKMDGDGDRAPSSSTSTTKGRYLSFLALRSRHLGCATALVLGVSCACAWTRRQVPMCLYRLLHHALHGYDIGLKLMF